MKKSHAVVTLSGHGKKNNPEISHAECYDFAWGAKTDAPGKAILLVLAENRGWVDDLREALEDCGIWMPAPKMHLGALLRDGLIHRRSGGGFVLDIAVAASVEAAA